MKNVVVLQNLLLLTAVIIAAATDVRKGLVYNWLTIPGIFAGLAISAWQGGWAGLGLSFLGILVGGGALFLLFYFEIMGGGDVKLMAVIGALMGPSFVIETLLVSIMAGGVIGFCLMIIRGKLKPTLVWYVECLKAIGRAVLYKGIALTFPKNPEVGTAPFAVSILIGVVLVRYFDVLGFVRFW
jgi:prepilin peptidase CpaA